MDHSAFTLHSLKPSLEAVVPRRNRPGAPEIVLVEAGADAWATEIEQVLGAHHFRVVRVPRVAFVPQRMRSGNVTALLLGAGVLAPEDLVLLRDCRQANPALRVVSVSVGAPRRHDEASEMLVTLRLAWPEGQAALLETLAGELDPMPDRRPTVIVYAGWSDATSAYRDALGGARYDVRVVHSFEDASTWLTLLGRSAVLLFFVPPIEAVRRSLLRSLRLAHPAVPVVALARRESPRLREDVRRAGISHLLAAGASADAVVEAVRSLLLDPRKERA